MGCWSSEGEPLRFCSPGRVDAGSAAFRCNYLGQASLPPPGNAAGPSVYTTPVPIRRRTRRRRGRHACSNVPWGGCACNARMTPHRVNSLLPVPKHRSNPEKDGNDSPACPSMTRNDTEVENSQLTFRSMSPEASTTGPRSRHLSKCRMTAPSWSTSSFHGATVRPTSTSLTASGWSARTRTRSGVSTTTQLKSF